MGARVIFLGTGDAANSGGRGHAGYVVATAGATLLLDCGPTALMAMRRGGLSPDSLDAIVLSHLHGDHVAGLPFFLVAYVAEPLRLRPLTVVGPPGTRARVFDLFRAMYRELSVRPLPFELSFVEVKPEVYAPVAGMDILPFSVPHQRSEMSLGYRIDAGGAAILYSGDSGWTEALVTHSQGTDLFICECFGFETRVDFHLDYPRVAANRHRFGCRRLVLSHIGPEVLARRAEVELELAEDGMVIDLDQ